MHVNAKSRVGSAPRTPYATFLFLSAAQAAYADAYQGIVANHLNRRFSPRQFQLIVPMTINYTYPRVALFELDHYGYGILNKVAISEYFDLLIRRRPPAQPIPFLDSDKFPHARGEYNNSLARLLNSLLSFGDELVQCHKFSL